LRIHNEDARSFLKSSVKKFDMIEIDLFQGSPYIPFYTVTVEFFSLVKEDLSEHGILAMNVHDNGNELVGAIESTLLEVYPSVFEIALGKNYILIAIDEELTLNSFKDKLVSQNEDINHLVKTMKVRKITSRGSLILTDDKSPVEGLTRRMLKLS